MAKSSFIPKDFRPFVPGSKLQSLNLLEMGKAKFSKEASEDCILFLYAKDDIVPGYFLRDVNPNKLIIHLHYDELGILWDFSFSEGSLKIHTCDKVVSPFSIYHRHPGISQNHPYYQKHIAFFEILDIWDGNLLGQKRDHYQNFSKAYQEITSIRNSSLATGGKIKYPRSFFLKGSYGLLADKSKESLIVKSCSNIRSKVVSEETFSKWDLENLNNLPTFFQEKVIGDDIRVHVCGNSVWPLQVKTKDCIDYRYASKGSVKYQEIKLPASIKAFCKTIAKIESNKFVGVDLMKSGSIYFCLESNPGPGWSTYHHSSKKKFSKNVFKQLLRR